MLLTPVPEPSTALLAVIAGTGLLLAAPAEKPVSFANILRELGGEQAGTVNHGKNMNLVRAYFVYHSIRAFDYFSDIWVLVFGNHLAGLRKTAIRPVFAVMRSTMRRA